MNTPEALEILRYAVVKAGTSGREDRVQAMETIAVALALTPAPAPVTEDLKDAYVAGWVVENSTD
jgi:surface antigen